MSQIILPGKQQQESIALQTREKTNIENCQSGSISGWEKSSFDDYEKKYATTAVFRSNPTHIYNCHGLSFASRRTQINSIDEVKKIIAQDNYKAIAENQVLPGDIVIYYHEGDMEHSGVVVAEPTPQTLNQPMILSKWGKFREAIHPLSYCPYKHDHLRFYRIWD